MDERNPRPNRAATRRDALSPRFSPPVPHSTLFLAPHFYNSSRQLARPDQSSRSDPVESRLDHLPLQTRFCCFLDRCMTGVDGTSISSNNPCLDVFGVENSTATLGLWLYRDYVVGDVRSLYVVETLLIVVGVIMCWMRRRRLRFRGVHRIMVLVAMAT